MGTNEAVRRKESTSKLLFFGANEGDSRVVRCMIDRKLRSQDFSHEAIAEDRELSGKHILRLGKIDEETRSHEDAVGKMGKRRSRGDVNSGEWN